MTVIYFTDGALIDDVLVRRSLLRIPEVISEMRKSQNEFVDSDLFLAMNEQSTYLQLNYHQKKYLKKALQNGLYQRWLKNKIEPDLIIKRTDYLRTDDLISVFQRLSTIDSLNIVTIGPGFDEIESLLRLQLKVCTNPLQDVISRDPHLNWFWTDLKSQIQLHS
jgi:hypothetical protein